MKKNRIVYNLILSMIYYSINMLSNFWLTSVIIEELGKEAYSFYPLANNICGWMIIISSAINSMLARHISISMQRNDIETARSYYSTALVADCVIGGILVIPIYLISIFSTTLFDVPVGLEKQVQFLFVCVLITVPVDMIGTVMSTAWTAKNRLDLQYYARLLQMAIKLSVIIYIKNDSQLSLRTIGFAILISDIVFFFSTYLIKRGLMPEVTVRKDNFSSKLLGDIATSGIWNSINQLGNSLLFQCDLMVSNISLGVIEAASVSIVATIPNAITAIVTLLTSIFMPSLYKDYANASNNNYMVIVDRLKKEQIVVGGLIGIIIINVLAFGEVFFDLWVPGNDTRLLVKLSYFYLIPLLISSMFRGVSNIGIIFNKIRFQALMMLINGLINIICMLLLIRFTDLGIVSIVLTTCAIISVWYGVIIPIYISKILKCKICELYKSPAILLTFEVIYYLMLLITRRYLQFNNTWINFLLVIVASAAIGCFILLILLITLRSKGRSK